MKHEGVVYELCIWLVFWLICYLSAGLGTIIFLITTVIKNSHQLGVCVFFVKKIIKCTYIYNRSCIHMTKKGTWTTPLSNACLYIQISWTLLWYLIYQSNILINYELLSYLEKKNQSLVKLYLRFYSKFAK